MWTNADQDIAFASVTDAPDVKVLNADVLFCKYRSTELDYQQAERSSFFKILFFHQLARLFHP